ncbi:MAG: N-acetylglucosamine-6-phosphate deacetylase [Lentisphaeria bacterium]
MKTLIHNACLISPGIQIEKGAVLIVEDRIEQVLTPRQKLPQADQYIDLQGLRLLPGFIDIHCHGRSNQDFCDGTDEATQTIGRDKLQEGVAGFLATTLSASQNDLQRTLQCAERYRKENTNGARLLGIHIEGNFFNPEGAGAQNPDFLMLPDFSLVAKWNTICPIRKVSYSPELPGALEFTRQLAEAGIMPSGAHSTADYEQTQLARLAGMKHLTHFCNVMTPLHHLHFGMVGAGLTEPDIYVEIICDGVHLIDPMIKLILQMKGPERVMLITDAIRAAGMPDGDYSLGGLPVVVKNGKAMLADANRVAGSTLQFYKGVQRAAKVSGLPPSELVKTTAWNQAHSLGLQGYGKIEPGFFADFTITDSDWTPKQTWIAGAPRWQTK